jgi:PKD repeat protein
MNNLFSFQFRLGLSLVAGLLLPYFLQAQTPCAEVDFTYEVKENVLTCKGRCTKDVQTWYWQFGDNTEVTTGQSVSHAYAKGGEFQVCMKALVNEDCKVSVCKKLTIGSSTTTSECGMKADFDVKTEGLTIILNGRSNDDKASYFFQLSSGNIQVTGKDAKFAVPAQGSYEVCMTAVNGAQNCKERVCKKVEVKGPCALQADFALTQHGDVVVLMAKSTAGDAAKYYWSLGNGTSLEGKDAKYQYPKSGDYEICLKVVQSTAVSTTANACSVTICKKVRVDGNTADCPLKADYSYVTNGKTVNFAAVSNDANATYNWYVPWQNTPLTGKDVQITFEKEGTFDVCLVVLDAKNVCKVKVCKKVTAGSKIRVYPNPASDVINVASDTKIIQALIYNQYNELKLTAQVQSTEGSIDITSLADGVYIITLELADGAKISQKFLKRS